MLKLPILHRSGSQGTPIRREECNNLMSSRGEKVQGKGEGGSDMMQGGIGPAS
jgi:hypothetical protein